jgi:hypothetical protein
VLLVVAITANLVQNDGRMKREGMGAATGLDSLQGPLSRCLDAKSARRLVEFRVDPPVGERIDRLGERANKGTLKRGRTGRVRSVN